MKPIHLFFELSNPALWPAFGFVLAFMIAFGLVIYPYAAGKPLTPYLTVAGGIYATAVIAIITITKGGF